MAEKKNKPEIRFKGFDGEWEVKELGEIVKITMGQSPNGVNYTDNPEDYILVQGNADMKNGNVVPRVWTKQVTKIADAEDLIMSVRAPVGEIGKTAYNVVIGRGVAAIKANEFIFQSLKRMNENNYWKQFSAGSTFDSINSNDLSKALISTTKDDEQSQIGTFLKHLDHLITLHQRKYYKLVTVKKAMLEKMFPQNGAVVPEIRFKGFNESWEEKEFKGICWFQEGPGLRYWQFTNLGIKVINITNLENGILNLERTDRHISLKEFHNMYEHFEIQENDIVVASSGNSYGKVAIVRKQDLPLLMNTSVIRFKPLSSLDYDYLLVFLKSNQFKNQIDLLITGGAQPNFGPVHLNKIQTNLPPNILEQSKIGKYFKNLDNLITLQQSELEKLKNIKKACLEKMFV